MNDSQTCTDADSLACLITEADGAINALTAGRREVCAEYNERIRKLRDLKVTLHIVRDAQDGEPFDVEATVSPEMLKLVRTPTWGL